MEKSEYIDEADNTTHPYEPNANTRSEPAVCHQTFVEQTSLAVLEDDAPIEAPPHPDFDPGDLRPPGRSSNQYPQQFYEDTLSNFGSMGRFNGVHTGQAGDSADRCGTYTGHQLSSSECTSGIIQNEPFLPLKSSLSSDSTPESSNYSSGTNSQRPDRPTSTPLSLVDQALSEFPSLRGDINLDQQVLGQSVPPGLRPKVKTEAWLEENTLYITVEVSGQSLSRRLDNNLINGTKLLNLTGVSRGRRDGILKQEKVRHVVRMGNQNLKGVWIPFERAYEIARIYRIVDNLYPLFLHDLEPFLYSFGNLTRTLQVVRTAQRANEVFALWNSGIPRQNCNLTFRETFGKRVRECDQDPISHGDSDQQANVKRECYRLAHVYPPYVPGIATQTRNTSHLPYPSSPQGDQFGIFALPHQVQPNSINEAFNREQNIVFPDPNPRRGKTPEIETSGGDVEDPNANCAIGQSDPHVDSQNKHTKDYPV